ncbi:Ctr copper transporter family protein [Cordyceps fumosorosea ARSEF 2679]|uniref:Copper transport protein n=1 Tax=Cordyceps fumosorosea (strain ARSEF 2679) TaxID=1081104 RepID=A0A167V1U0_CORFA|nr:Ctr copper transporter family protein [Cordyceps fumosorosea ARSEF 2679]OAA62134.1 Ctr copper transporter family protein [Cordyceps fumosorosea ARSEF 2679]
MDHGGMDHGGMDHGGMDMGGGSGGRQCKIDMLFNVNTIGSCFFTKDFYIETNGQFAGACILALVLVVALEGLRRATREFDRFITAQHVAQHRSGPAAVAGPRKDSSDGVVAAAPCAPIPPFRPSLVQQAIRASLHMLQFGTAYIVMLFAMYYNGYIILCIVLGAFVGYMAFNWEPIAVSDQPNGTKEATVCCG